MKREFDLPLSRFQGSEGWEERIENIDAFPFLSAFEKILYCFEKKMSVYDAMSKCRVSFGAMLSFLKVWKEFEEEERIKERDRKLKEEMQTIDQYEFNQETGEVKVYRLDADGNKIYKEKKNHA